MRNVAKNLNGEPVKKAPTKKADKSETEGLRVELTVDVYMCFAKEERPKVLKDNPNFSDPREVSIELGARWRKLNDKDKKRFEALATKEEAVWPNYEAEMKKHKK